MGVLLVSALAFPFLVLALMWPRKARTMALRTAPWAAAPALAAALTLPSGTVVTVPWLFLGGTLALDPVANVFLLFTAGLWLAAGIYAKGYLETNHDRRKPAFFAWFLGTMGGNLALIPAQDVVSYIAFFTLMSLCAYGLIVHERSARNLFAGRIYIAMAVLGEVTAFAGFVLASFGAAGAISFDAVSQAIGEAPNQGLILLLLVIGFGIKLGVMPLHFWLPLAHPAAPTPASAVLSGVIIKTGLLLMLRLFPFDGGAAVWPDVLIAGGLFTAFAGVAAGMPQTHPKALLAYSSISQMGLVAVGLGIALTPGVAAEAAVPMLLVYAAHHAMAKGALFLGTGLAACDLPEHHRRRLLWGVGLTGAALAGFPLTSGLAAKGYLKYMAQQLDGPWDGLLGWLLPLTGVTTMLLIIRFVVMLAPRPQAPHGQWNRPMAVPWAMLTAGVLVYPWALLALGLAETKQIGMYLPGMMQAGWPPLAAVAVAAAMWKVRPLMRALRRVRIPPGDLLPAVIAVFNLAGRLFHYLAERPGRAAQRTPAFLQAQWLQYHGAVLQNMARRESFALGLLLMTLLALGMALVM